MKKFYLFTSILIFFAGYLCWKISQKTVKNRNVSVSSYYATKSIKIDNSNPGFQKKPFNKQKSPSKPKIEAHHIFLRKLREDFHQNSLTTAKAFAILQSNLPFDLKEAYIQITRELFGNLYDYENPEKWVKLLAQQIATAKISDNLTRLLEFLNSTGKYNDKLIGEYKQSKKPGFLMAITNKDYLYYQARSNKDVSARNFAIQKLSSLGNHEKLRFESLLESEKDDQLRANIYQGLGRISKKATWKNWLAESEKELLHPVLGQMAKKKFLMGISQSARSEKTLFLFHYFMEKEFPLVINKSKRPTQLLIDLSAISDAYWDEKKEERLKVEPQWEAFFANELQSILRPISTSQEIKVLMAVSLLQPCLYYAKDECMDLLTGGHPFLSMLVTELAQLFGTEQEYLLGDLKIIYE